MSCRPCWLFALALCLVPSFAAGQTPRLDSYGDPLPAGAIARLGSIRWRVDGSPSSLRFAPDGKSLFVFCDGALHRLDAAAGKPLGRLRVHNQGPIVGIGKEFAESASWCLSPDERFLAQTDNPTTEQRGIFVRELATGKDILEVSDRFRIVTCLRFSPDSRQLATAEIRFKERDDLPKRLSVCIHLWDLATSKETGTIAEADGMDNFRPISFSFAPDGRRLAVVCLEADKQHYVHVWDLPTRKRLWKLKEPTDLANPLVFAPDSTRLAAVTGEKLQLWDAASGKLLRTLAESIQTNIALVFSPEGTNLAAAAEEGPMHTWETATGKELPTYGNDVRGVVFAPGGRVVIAQKDHSVRVIEAGSGKELQRWEADFSRLRDLKPCLRAAAQGGGWPIALAPDGDTLAAGGLGLVRRWSLTTGKELLPPGGNEGPTEALAVSRDGSRLAAGGVGAVLLWDTATGKLIRRLNQPSLAGPGKQEEAGVQGRLPTMLAFAPDDRRLAAGWGSGAVTAWDAGAGKALWGIREHNESVSGLAFNAAGTSIISAGGARVAWSDANTGRQTRLWSIPKIDQEHAHQVLGLSSGPWTAITGSQECLSKVWELATGKQRRELAINGHRMRCWIRCSPDGRFGLLFHDFQLVLVDLDSGKELRHLGDRFSFRDAVFAPDGATVAACGYRGIDLLEIATGTILGHFDGHQGGTSAVAFCPDGGRLFSAGADSAILIWDTRTKSAPPELSDHELETQWALLADTNAARAGEALTRLAASAKALPFLKEKIHARSGREPIAPQEELRQLRVVELLEWHGGVAARQLLQTLAQQGEAPRVRSQARVSLELLLLPLPVGEGRQVKGAPDREEFGEPLPLGARLRLGSLRFQHDTKVRGLRYLPDGKTLLSGGCGWNYLGSWRSLCLLAADTGQRRWAQPTELWEFYRQTNEDKEKSVKVSAPRWCVSPDGRFLGTVGEAFWRPGPVVRARDLATGKDLFEVKDDTTQFTFVQFAPDGKSLAALDHNGVIRICQVPGGTELRRLDPLKGEPAFEPLLFSFTPDGRRLIVLGKGAHHAPVCIYDALGFQPPLRLAETSAFSSPAALSPDGKILAMVSRPAAGGQSRMRLWSTLTGEPIQSLGVYPPNKDKQHAGDNPSATDDLVFSPNGKMLASRRGDHVDLWDLAMGRQLPGLEMEGLHSILLAPGAQAILAGRDSIRVHDSRSGKLLHEWSADPGTRFGGSEREGSFYAAHQGLGRGIALTPDGKILAAAQGTRVRRWRLATGEEIDRPVSLGPIEHLAVSANGQRVAALNTAQVLLWDAAAGKLLHTLTLDMPPGKTAPSFCCVTLSPGGGRIGAGTSDGDVVVWDSTGKRLWQQRVHGNPVDMLTFVSAGQVLISTAAVRRVAWQDASTGRLQRALTAAESGANDETTREQRQGENLALAGERVLAVCLEEVELWELGSGQRRRSLATAETNGRRGVYGYAGAALSGDGRILALPVENGIQLWSTVTGQQLRSVAGLAIHTIALSADGKLVAAVGGENAMIWDTATGTILAKLAGHRGPVLSAAFSGDRRTLATGGQDSTVVVWDVASLVARPVVPSLAATELPDLWQRLATEDARQAHDALLRLAGDPALAVRLLRKQTTPAAAPSDARMTRLIAGLDSDVFSVREQAREELEKLGSLAEAPLRKALGGTTSTELQRRLDGLLEMLEGPVTRPEQARALRCVELLERVGTAEARSILEELGHGASSDRQTREARAALERLARRVGRP